MPAELRTVCAINISAFIFIFFLFSVFVTPIWLRRVVRGRGPAIAAVIPNLCIMSENNIREVKDGRTKLKLD